MTLNVQPSIRQVMQDNIVFFSSFFFYLITGAILLNLIPQGQEIMFFSERRSPNGDMFFLYATKLGEGLAFVGGLVLLLLYRYRSALWLPVAGFSVSLLSYLTKSYFAHERPSLYFRNLGIFDQINIVEGIQSIFTWDNKVDKAQETLLILKTKQELVQKIISVVKDLHSYDVPEIIALPIIDGSEDYLNWIKESTD